MNSVKGKMEQRLEKCLEENGGRGKKPEILILAVHLPRWLVHLVAHPFSVFNSELASKSSMMKQVLETRCMKELHSLRKTEGKGKTSGASVTFFAGVRWVPPASC